MSFVACDGYRQSRAPVVVPFACRVTLVRWPFPAGRLRDFIAEHGYEITGAHSVGQTRGYRRR